jgi:tRNA (cmo5U34)-methyltransferase
VDNAAPMLERARSAIGDPRVSFLEADVRGVEFEPAGAVTMNWVLQFLPPEARVEILSRIRQALVTDGALLLSEKVHSEDPAIEAFNFSAHLDFKRANGYSDLEISQKRTALEQVMVPDTIEAQLDRLRQAGFREVQVWFQCLNWASFIATP